MQPLPQKPQVRRRGRDRHRTPGPHSTLDESGYTRRQLVGAPVRHGRMLQPGRPCLGAAIRGSRLLPVWGMRILHR